MLIWIDSDKTVSYKSQYFSLLSNIHLQAYIEEPFHQVINTNNYWYINDIKNSKSAFALKWKSQPSITVFESNS